MEDCQKTGRCREEQMERIYEYLDGALSAADIQEICQHLEQCEACSREYDLECLIRTSVRRSCREAAPQDLKDGILARIDALREGSDEAAHRHR